MLHLRQCRADGRGDGHGQGHFPAPNRSSAARGRPKSSWCCGGQVESARNSPPDSAAHPRALRRQDSSSHPEPPRSIRRSRSSARHGHRPLVRRNSRRGWRSSPSARWPTNTQPVSQMEFIKLCNLYPPWTDHLQTSCLPCETDTRSWSNTPQWPRVHAPLNRILAVGRRGARLMARDAPVIVVGGALPGCAARWPLRAPASAAARPQRRRGACPARQGSAVMIPQQYRGTMFPTPVRGTWRNNRRW